jgi:ABC-type sugar transport system permease subunit
VRTNGNEPSQPGLALFCGHSSGSWIYCRPKPPEPFEAATVAASPAPQRFRHLTFPMMLPTLIAAAVLRVMDLLKVIDIVYVMFGGGLGHSSETINLNN